MTSRIAIATADGLAVADHLAHSTAFIVLEVEESRVVARSERKRETGCGNHKSFVEMLEGCQAVICGGIGPGAFDALKANGVESIVTAKTPAIEEAISQYLAGTLATTEDRICLCH
jgi:predicted Fe-Mo cluster-binding NifX family protein